jgi:eukaryotic-like serine/threonine-protein kinase
MSHSAEGGILEPPEQLREALADRYPVERPLGRGGMATVYLARDLRHQRPVAVKVLHPELAAGLGTERFLREIRIEAGLQHPHILPLHDSGEAAGFLYYVMPFVSGESLRQRLAREGRLSVEDTVRIASDVADALAYAHAHGVVHRDIKPENILLSNGHALVADFGIAKAVEAAGDSKLTETGWGMGTPAYMSPEQIVGEPVDGRSDVYGLGCVVYEMLTGHPPFPADNARAMFTRHQVETPPPISADRPEVPAHLQDAVLTALAKLPTDRFATAAEFVARLSAPGGIRAARPSRWTRLWTRSRRRVLVATAAAVALLGGGWAYLRGHPAAISAGRGSSVAVLPIADLDGDTSQAYVSAGLTEQLITDLAQSRDLRVINRLTMEKYARRRETPREVARALGVDAVLTGSLQRIGDSVHFTAQLIPKGSDRAEWAGSYGGTRADLLRIQREIAWTVAARLLGARPAGPSVAAGDPDAIDAYVRGRYWWGKRNGPSLLKAIQFFGQALDADPRFAPAYAGMADAYIQLGYQSLLAPDDAFPKAAAAARKALEIDSTLAEPHATLAFYHFYYPWDWKAAEQEFRLAVAKNPSYATAHEWYGLFLAAMGRFDEAHREEDRAQSLDPLSVAITGTNAWVYHYSHRQDEAERLLRQAVRTDSTFGLGRLYLGRVLQAKGELDSAITEYGRLPAAFQQWVPTVAGLGNMYALEGRRADALAVLRRLDSLSRTQYVTSYAVAVVHAALGWPDSAFAWLDRAVQERTHWLVWLNRDPRWESIRRDPRFAEVVDRVGLPP